MQILKTTLEMGAQNPRRQMPGDAGYDLYVLNETTIAPGSFCDVDTGVCIQLPEGVWALICGRSSALRRHNLMVAQGVIDNGYRGPLFCGVWNLGMWDVKLMPGDRVAQLIPFPLVDLRVMQVDQLSSSVRGTLGFGSTG